MVVISIERTDVMWVESQQGERGGGGGGGGRTYHCAYKCILHM